jgi:hypothetical protein
MADSIVVTGCPVDVPWRRGLRKTLHQLTSADLIADAEALEADAVKLRTIYH